VENSFELLEQKIELEIELGDRARSLSSLVGLGVQSQRQELELELGEGATIWS